MFRIRLVEQPMPTGSKDPDVLLAWLLDSMGLVRSRTEGATVDEEQGAIHRMVRHTLLEEPLKGWDNAAISEFSGLSQTGVHNQMHKLREVGLISSRLKGRWHVNVLRGGSMASAVELIAVQTRAIAVMRLAELGDAISDSESRMVEAGEDESQVFRIYIAEPGPTPEDSDRLDCLLSDLGITGDRVKKGDTVTRQVFDELASSERPLTLQTLADRTEETRSRAQRVVERLRQAGIVDRVAMRDRIAMDVYAGLMRQYSARGEEWLMGRGGLGRLDEDISTALIKGVRKDKMSIEKVEEILATVSIDAQRLLLNTLGGRMPYGYRIAGKNGADIAERVMINIDRTLRRWKTVAQRLDEAVVTE
ncbi:MAG: helix-turn-helix domain-containing protein [Candidatus Thermoplasmatota archaeon]|nr:helix-turn-helix domain-containing protein [Candidatus Thermoplasmatota archaeon]MEC8955374.1 helix-turn-helix domain-containing protein [Candidatus Thermoplasmatota archaeon]MEC9351546.1 helix-turn-helix domain-containing protein [Candidatus Thermoplasmatota archaeon]MEC9393564.1 helix-turn-helix domain-containing protein [Candidatus Thermoplasmatota archaeon]MEC9478016.1 helix-turn-helix domain-containing protein [Candidatus Thermoplasmatota archaeon]